jgi:hypothetical protein
MNCRKDMLDLDVSLPICIVFKCSNQGPEAATEDTVERGWGSVWVYACLNERGWGEEAAALHTVKGEGGTYVGGGRWWVPGMWGEKGGGF